MGTALLGTFLSLTYYFQGTLHYSAMKSGFAFVPFSLGIIAGATVASRFLPRFGPRALMSLGLLMAAVGLTILTTLTMHSSYFVTVLPAEVIISLGMGMSFVAMSSTALIGVHPEDAGVASALVNATQQTGGSMGAALINTIATTATASFLVVHGTSPAALAAGAIHGYTTAFTFSAIVLAVAAASAFVLIRRTRTGAPNAAAEGTIDAVDGDQRDPSRWSRSDPSPPSDADPGAVPPRRRCGSEWSRSPASR